MEDRLDPKDILLEAAGEIFAEKGLEQATVREICGKAGLNIAAVNYYFRDKKALYVEAVKLAHCTGGQTPQFEVLEGAPPEQVLEAFLRQMMGMMLDDVRPTWHLELMMREMARPTEACVELVRSFIGPMFETLKQIIRPLLPTEISPFNLNLHAFSIVAQCLLYRYHRPVGRILVGEDGYTTLMDLDRLTRHITDFSLAALRGASTPSKGATATQSVSHQETKP
jgi:TetR/AcrR family transcriptional regulator, regulator of cefoperazone and chloramphenicol sensitivity